MRPKNKASFKAVIQLPLTPELVSEIVTLGQINHDDIWLKMSQLIDSGLKLSIFRNNSDGTYSVSVLDQDPDSANGGLMLYANGSTKDLAMAALWYKIEFVAGHRSWEEAAKAANAPQVS